ncbi:hypothetical protein [Hyphomicrobium sp. D-2]|uniref:hypothetical protein n=1 Tax=Hyphomicrobium sp. D-2 TaxID=3041621 RepID=UPI0024563072|nr:hypothetical protein [Hyphomicrobium sp. D-2]MDH4980961.1 hypothetical protein [Hyphomicrobium sp. D-2]
MCAVSAAMNWLFLSSLGETPLEAHVLGAASAAADILKALLPFFIAWRWREKGYVAVILGSLAFAFFAGFSLLSAIGFAAQTRGALVDSRDGASQEYARMQSAMAEANVRRKALPAHRSAAIVSEEIERHRQNRRWSATKGCVNATELQSREFCAAYFALRAELATAKEEDRLVGQIAVLQEESAKLRGRGAGQDSDPQVTLLSRIFGLGEESVRLSLIIAVALLVEIGASLGLFLASGHGGSEEADEQAQPPTSSPEPGPIEDFCLEALVSAPRSRISDDELLALYQGWCAAKSLAPMESEEFLSAFAVLASVLALPRKAGLYYGIAAFEPERRAAA